MLNDPHLHGLKKPLWNTVSTSKHFPGSTASTQKKLSVKNICDHSWGGGGTEKCSNKKIQFVFVLNDSSVFWRNWRFDPLGSTLIYLRSFRAQGTRTPVHCNIFKIWDDLYCGCRIVRSYHRKILNWFQATYFLNGIWCDLFTLGLRGITIVHKTFTYIWKLFSIARLPDYNYNYNYNYTNVHILHVFLHWLIWQRKQTPPWHVKRPAFASMQQKFNGQNIYFWKRGFDTEKLQHVAEHVCSNIVVEVWTESTPLTCLEVPPVGWKVMHDVMECQWNTNG